MNEKEPREHDAALSARIGTPAAKILIVDDEPAVCEILSRWLDSEGYNCHTANSAKEALKLIRSDSFGLLVLDIRMPEKSGIELLSTTRQRFPDMAVIMVTAVDDRKTAILALELGAYGYVIKPFEQNEVIISVISALERRRLVLESRDYERSLEQRVREQTEDVRISRREICLRLMAAQQYHHDETGAHIRRIGRYAEVLAGRVGYSGEQAEMLCLAAPLHDVGKIGVPDTVLLKPGELTQDERDTMKPHTTIGGRILEGSTGPLVNMSRDIALRHHEKWNGSGYPDGLLGDDIPEPARIVAILDVYDALLHDRVYRPAVPEEKALQISTDGRGSHFDPRVVDVFMQVLPELRRIREELKEQ